MGDEMTWAQTAAIAVTIAVTVAASTWVMQSSLRRIERDIEYYAPEEQDPASFDCTVEPVASTDVLLTFPVETPSIGSSRELKISCKPQ
jgi:hypothetical protein